MKHFIFTGKEHKPRRDANIKRTVRIYEVKRNVPVFLAEFSDYFSGYDQMVLEAMELHKLLPRKAFERNPNTGSCIHGSLYTLKGAGIATITQVT